MKGVVWVVDITNLVCAFVIDYRQDFDGFYMIIQKGWKDLQDAKSVMQH